MRPRTILLALAFCAVAALAAFAADNPHMGTWKLNEAKSKMTGKARNSTVAYSQDGDNVKVTIDGVDDSGAALHTEWVGKFDGKPYPVTGDPTGNSRSYKQVNDHTLAFTGMKDGKTVVSGRATVAADGKTRTVTSSSTDAAGKKSSQTLVYDKQ